MLFDSLDKLKQNSIMSSILMLVLGAVIMICPQAHMGILTLVIGYTLLVAAIVMMLNFASSKKTLMDFLKFVGALMLGLVGLCAVVFRDDIVRVMAWLFAFLLVLDGARTALHSFTYARRSQRKGWWVLSILSALLIASGAVLFANPWWGTTDRLAKVIGCTMFFSSMVSALRLIWTWPIRNAQGGNGDDE